MGFKICPKCGEENFYLDVFCKKCDSNIQSVSRINQSTPSSKQDPPYDYKSIFKESSILKYVKSNNPINEIDSVIKLIEQENKNEGGKILVELLKVEPNNENAWLLLSICIEDKVKKGKCLKKVVSLNPRNALGWQLLSEIEEKDEQKRYYSYRAQELNKPFTTQNKKIEISQNNQRTCSRCGSLNNISSTYCWNCGINMKFKTNMKDDPNELIVKKTEPDSGAKTLGSISVICGVIGIFVFGIPLGIIAIACGIPALSKGANSGKSGIILGILDIVLAIFILMVL